MEFELLKDNSSIIKVIGVGGGGSNAVNHMHRQGIKGVDFIVCNTDAQALEISPVPTKIQLGMSLTEGRGAGSIPEIGKNAAIENIDEIRKLLVDTKMVFITAGMGGGTGTGAAPIIAQTAKDMGILTVGIITIPFAFEGKKRKQQADDGIEQLKNSVDSILIICNDKLREMYGNLKLSEAFSHADDILTIAAKGIAEIITVTGYINVDFEDVKTAVSNSGVAIMGSAQAEGENRAIKAVEQALASPLLNDNNIKGARFILMNVASGSKEVTMDEIGSITDYIQDEAGLTADIIWGNCKDETLGEKVSVTIIATGFKTREELGKEENKVKKIVTDLYDPVKNEMASTIKNVEKDMVAKEPELIHKDDEPIQKDEPAQRPDREIIFEFDMGSIPAKENVTPTPVVEDRSKMKKEELILPSDELKLGDISTEEQLRKSRERVMKLKELSYRIGNANNLSDMEKEPAYKRRNIKLDTVTHSSETNVSRYTLNNEDDKKAEIRPNNSFLHDNVD